jgi:hypothetical protein
MPGNMRAMTMNYVDCIISAPLRCGARRIAAPIRRSALAPRRCFLPALSSLLRKTIAESVFTIEQCQSFCFQSASNSYIAAV